MRVYGFLRKRTPMVRVVFDSGAIIEGPLMEVMTRADVLKSIEPVVLPHNRPKIA